MAESAKRPILLAWDLVDEAMEQLETGQGMSLDMSMPADPAENALVVFSLVQIAVQALIASAVDETGEVAPERLTAVVEVIRRVTTEAPDPVRGPSAEDARAAGHFGSDGPVDATYRFLRTVDSGTFDEVWSQQDLNLRLVRAQAWLWNNRSSPEVLAIEIEDLAQSWVDGKIDDTLWPCFAAIEMDSLRSSWDRWLAWMREGLLGAGSASRLIGPDLELIVLVPTDGEPLLFTEPTLVDNAFTIVVRRADDRWLVAAYGDRLPEPGWPPIIH